MYSVSNAYINAVHASSRDIRNLSVTVGGQTYSGGKIRGLSLKESVSENSDRLLPGCAACASIETTIVGVLSDSLIGSEMTAKSGVVLPGGTIEYVPLGVFIVQDVQHAPGTNISTLIGYDRMSLLDGEDFSHWREGTYDPKTVRLSYAEVLNSIVPFDNSGAIQWASVPSYIQEDSFIVRPYLEDLLGYNCKELLGYVAGLYGKFARFTRNGKLEFAWYSHCGLTIPSKANYLDGLTIKSANDVTDTITYYSVDGIGSTGYGDYTNDLVSVGTAVLADPITTVSSPGTLKYRGNPAIRAGDVVTVTLRGGSTRRFSVSEHTLTFSGGGLSGLIESHGLARKTFHSLTATEREITRLKRSYAETATEEETTSGI